MALGSIANEEIKYNVNLAQIIGQIMVDINGAITTRGLDILESFAQQYMLDAGLKKFGNCLLYTSPSPRDLSTSRMPSSA